MLSLGGGRSLGARLRLQHMIVGAHSGNSACAVRAHAHTCAAAPRLPAKNSDTLIQTIESEVTFFPPQICTLMGSGEPTFEKCVTFPK